MKYPKASKRKNRQLWEAKGIDPATQRPKSYYAATPDEASRKAADSLGMVPKHDGTLYGYYALVYLPTVVHRSENWKEQIAWAMDLHVLPQIGHLRLEDIDRPALQRLFNGMLGSLSVGSVKRAKKVLSCVLALAEQDGMGRNAARVVRLPEDRPKPKSALAFHELRLLIEHSQPERLRPLVLLCGCAGLRIGEACAQSAADIERGTLRVRRQILQTHGGARLTSTLKTPQSVRDIPLPFASELPDSGYLASSDTGGPVLPKNVRRDLLRACDQAKVRRVSPHELRHTFVSLLENDLECPAAIVAALAGRKHAGPNAGYSHVTEAQKRRWMEKFWERLSAGCTKNQLRTG